MKLFEDKVYTEMDWLEAACQPIKDTLNLKLQSMPDKVEVKPEMFLKWSSPMSLDTGDVLRKHMPDGTNYEDMRLLESCYKFHVEGEPVLNTKKGEIVGGTISLVKVKKMFDEKEIEDRLFSASLGEIKSMHYRGAEISCMNEMLELLGLEEARKQRSKKEKVNAIKEEMTAIMKENRWMIRDMDLSNKIGKWVRQYVERGNLAALSNFCKLKVMTHNGQPIYSIVGEEDI